MTTTLVTGANRGIGFELARQSKERGDDVIAVCRSSSPELDALGVRVESGIDVTSADDVARLGAALADTRIDVLINNAGLLSLESLTDMDFDRMRQQFEVNSLGPLRITHALLDCLGDGSKVAILTSRMGSIEDNTSGGCYGYRMSKAAVSAAGKSLSIDLKGRGVPVIILHPGFVRTAMTGNNGAVEPADAAVDLLARISELTLETTGRFKHANGDDLPW